MNQESRIKKRNSAVLRLIHNSLFMIRKSVGFTLIELMVAISITAVLGTLGIAGFTNFNKAQVSQAASNEVVTLLNLAKSRAQSQIKPSTLCGSSETLNGYKVEILAPKNYSLYLRCSGDDRRVNEETKVLPKDISFDANESFFFPVLSGGVQGSGSIKLSGYGQDKYIVINSLGGVSVQSSAPTP